MYINHGLVSENLSCICFLPYIEDIEDRELPIFNRISNYENLLDDLDMNNETELNLNTKSGVEIILCIKDFICRKIYKKEI